MSIKKKPVSEKKKKANKKALKKTRNETEMKTKSDFDYGGIPNRDLKKNLGCG